MKNVFQKITLMLKVKSKYCIKKDFHTKLCVILFLMEMV